MYDEKVYQVALSLIPGIGDKLIKQLVGYCGSPEKVFTSSPGKLSLIPRIGRKLARTISISRLLDESLRIIEEARRHELEILFYTDDNYPSRLKQVQDGPSVLFYRGKPVMDTTKIISIVGSRKATGYGKRIVEEVIEGLVPHNALIVSGLAYGIDIHAHRHALRCGLPTVAVIAGGLNRIYPYCHVPVAEQMQGHGGILSEQSWDTLPEAHHFPRRNRIIAGLSDVTMVVEAAVKGGALITAEYAYAYDRDIFAVPGNLHQKFSEGCNQLIETLKANIFTGIKSLETVMNWDLDSEKSKKKKTIQAALSVEENEILNVLKAKHGPMAIDELCWRSQKNVNNLAGVLLNLEFKGIVRSLPGNQYTLN